MKKKLEFMPMDVPKYSMRIFWSEEDNAFIAVCPELGDGFSAFGDTPECAARELGIATRLALTVYEEDGRTPPEPNILPAPKQGEQTNPYAEIDRMNAEFEANERNEGR